MLGKLLKYEFKSTARTFGILYGVLLLVAIFGSLTMNVSGDGLAVVGTVLMISYSFLIGAVIFITFYMIITRFYRNLLQEEGYLMHTLPVHEWQQILSKLIVAVCWLILSSIVVIISVVIITIPFIIVVDSTMPFKYIMQTILNSIDMNYTLQAVKWFGITLVSCVNGILQIYMALAIGNLANRHKKLMAVVAFFVTNIVVDLVEGVINNIFDFTASTFSGYILNMVGVDVYQNVGYTLIINIVWSVIFFVITERILRNHLNLE